MKLADIAVLLEGGKRPAQPVCLLGGKSCADDGDLHRLLLEQRHAQRLAQDPAQLVRRKADLFLPVPAAQEGMHHVALDRPGADDRDLDHQVVKTLGPHPGQKVHLRPAFHLKDAKAVGAAEHPVGLRVLGRQGGQAEPLLVVFLQQIEGLGDAGQHPQGQDIDL